MAGKAPTWEGGSVRQAYEMPLVPDVIGRQRNSASRRRVAEGIAGEIEVSEEHARLLAIGLRAVESCPACVACLPCKLHSLAELGLVRGDAKKNRAVELGRGEEHALVMAAYSMAFERERGRKPSLTGADGNAVKLALQKHKVEVILEAIDGAFGDPFWKGRVTIRKICSNPDLFRGSMRSTAQARQTRQ